MWRILDREEQFHDPRGYLGITLRRYKSFQRFQRNAYIQHLAAAGCSKSEIVERVNKQLGENLHISSIHKILHGK